MKQLVTISAALIVLVLMGASDLAAQHQMGGQGGQQEQPASQQPMMGMMCPMMSGGMGMMPHMMMGGRIGQAGMGMMGSGQMDPKVMGQMLQLRGEILKAVGEVLVKHGKAMEGSK